MHYIFLAILGLTAVDFLRSGLAIRKAIKDFAKYGKPSLQTEFGKGTPFHLVIMGDSTFDVRGDSKAIYGPARVFINRLSAHHKVYVHMLAKAGARSVDVISEQLPKLKRLDQADLIVMYMGANDAFKLNSPFAVGRSYDKLFSFTESKKIPLITSELANYWHLGVFPLIHRAWLYLAIHIQNIGIRRAAKGTQYVVLAKTKAYHKKLHNERFKRPYLIDGVHSTDESALEWGQYLLDRAKHSPATANILGAKLR